jgi:hypothetical protein
MWHSRLDLTMKVYTDARLFDLQGALGRLPSVAPRVAPGVAPTAGNPVQPGLSPVNLAETEDVA